MLIIRSASKKFFIHFNFVFVLFESSKIYVNTVFKLIENVKRFQFD